MNRSIRCCFFILNEPNKLCMNTSACSRKNECGTFPHFVSFENDLKSRWIILFVDACKFRFEIIAKFKTFIISSYSTARPLFFQYSDAAGGKKEKGFKMIPYIWILTNKNFFKKPLKFESEKKIVFGKTVMAWCFFKKIKKRERNKKEYQALAIPTRKVKWFLRNK